MSKKRNISYIFSLACLLMAACDTESTVSTPPNGEEEAAEVRLKAAVCTVETTVSRSIISGTTLEEGASIGIFGLKDNKTNFTSPYLQNLECLYGTNGNLEPQSGGNIILYPAGQDELYLYGYYPYSSTLTTDENGEISIPVKGTSDQEDVTDYLFTGVVTGSKQSAMTEVDYAISVSLKHAMSILRIHLYTETEAYNAESHPTLQAISFTPRESQIGNMNLRTGIITSENPDNTASVSLNYRNEETPLALIANGTPIIKDFLLFPYESDTDSAIRRLILHITSPDGTNKDITVFDEANASEPPTIVRLKAGYITTIYIKYSQSMAAKASVSQWQNAEAHTFE